MGSQLTTEHKSVQLSKEHAGSLVSVGLLLRTAHVEVDSMELCYVFRLNFSVGL